MNSTQTPETIETATPDPSQGWNWGAFLLGWLWGLPHQTPIALLTLIPGVNLVMAFILGAKGNAWAWRNKDWSSPAVFRETQRRWAVAGAAIWLGVVVFGLALSGGILFTVRRVLAENDAYKEAMALMQQSPQVASLVGEPVDFGFPSGNVQTAGPTGHAELSFSVSGPQSEAKAFVDAQKVDGQWLLKRVVVKGDGGGVDLLNDGSTH